MANYTLPDFAPELRIVARGTASNLLTVVFDTATDLDVKRSPKIVMVDTKDATSISTGVDDVKVEDALTKQVVTGHINLVVDKPNADATKYLLANFELHLDAQGKPDKAGKFAFPPQKEIEQLILQAVADAFTDASLEMQAQDAAQAAFSEPAAPRNAGWMRPMHNYAYAGVSGSPRVQSATKPARWGKKMYAFVGLLFLLLALAFFKIMAAPSDPVQAAVNKALANDPRARDEQIEITRQTLKEMGLDPGKNGDLGCLAAQ